MRVCSEVSFTSLHVIDRGSPGVNREKIILIDGSFVYDRAYAFAVGNIESVYPDEIVWSVFLGGLSKGTTKQMIKDDLGKMNMQAVNHHLIKISFAQKVTLATVEKSNMLLKLKKVLINNTLVDVRPYIK